MGIKKRMYNFYYTIQTAYTFWGSIISSIGWASVIALDIHFLMPSVSAIYITGIAVVSGGIFLYIFGHYFMKHGGFAASQTFGGKKNPTRTNWASELAKAKLMIAQSEIIKQIALKNGFTEKQIDKMQGDEIKEVLAVQKDMEELLA
jgi:hypothetical protein